MNSTNQNQNQTAALFDNQTEISPLKARLNRMAIHVPGNFPTPAEVIPVIESRLAAHMKHISRTASSTSGDFIEWKQIHDAYTELLTDLRAEGRARACPARASARAASVTQTSPNQATSSVQKAPKQKLPIAPFPPTPPTSPIPPTATHQKNSPPENSSQARPTPPKTTPPNVPAKLPPPPATESPASNPSHHPSQPSHSPVPQPKNPSIHPDFSLFSDNFSSPLPAAIALAKARRDDRLLNLPLEDQETLVTWLNEGLTFKETMLRAAQPRPEGLDLKTNIAALHRFYHKHNLAERIADAADLVQSISPDAAKTSEAAFKILAQTHALHTMAGPDLDHAAFQQITRFLLRQEDQRIRQRALDIKEKRIAFDMQHKHYDIFKRTIEKLPEINEIVRNDSLTPEQKFREHWIKTFGVDTAEMIERANKKWAETHPEQQHTTPDYSNGDVIPPLTPEEEQAEVNEALDVMLGPGAGQ